jgi:hypothetical protein
MAGAASPALAAIALAVAATAAPARAADPHCDALLPKVEDAIGPSRLPTAADIIRLRDIGEPDSALYMMPTPLAVSPDSRRVAFVVEQADPASNRICAALVGLDLRDGKVAQREATPSCCPRPVSGGSSPPPGFRR